MAGLNRAIRWLKNLGLWRTGGAVACLMLLAAILAFPSVVLPVVALLCGGLFFFYGVKSYASVAIIMLSTSGPTGNGKPNGDGQKGRRSGLLGRLKGGGRAHPSRGSGGGKPYRLPPEKQPFISIQLPMYNENRVVDRLLAACTQLDYQNYEVLVADDSSDETLKTLERWAKHPKVKVSHRINRSGFKGA
ncbi:MAG TPA: glycosyltransferase, partial [Anaerolineales bacterium]|nr:glycosyltransferase [Anaerolineales bacterium]